jgi:uncharacterized protein (TIGR02646 family)
MRKLTRSAEPTFLSPRWKEWGEDWVQRHAQGKPFYWHKVGGEPVNQRLLPFLKAQTQDHCTFCDNFPVSPPSLDTIEHFRPKVSYPLQAYRWTNLYFCCMYCQQKGGPFNESVIAPDAPDYTFDRYFRWDHTQGTIEVNETATPEDQSRARETIRYFRLNDAHPALRKRCLIQRSKLSEQPIAEFPYRDYIGNPEPDGNAPA